MSPPFPSEIFDLIIDFLHDESDALKACCLVSKSWVHRTRKHLFARVKFSSKSLFTLWQKTFPDLSKSPAHYTRSLSIHTSEVAIPGDASVDDRIRTFSGVVLLHVEIVDTGNNVSLVPLHGLSPTLKSIRVHCRLFIPSSEIFSLVCSFPLLEDLTLDAPEDISEVDEWIVPSTSPKLTGYLDLKMYGGIRPAVRRLLELPSGLHFSKISVLCVREDVESMMDLVSKCSDTLKSLSICCHHVGAGILSALVVCQYLTATFWRSRA